MYLGKPVRAGAAVSPAAAILLFLAGGLPACNYSFRNPAEKLLHGQVSGRATAEGAPLGGASISLRGSAFDQISRPTGRFSYQPLPAGHHTLLLRQGLGRALALQVDVGGGSDGQVEGVTLGDRALPRAAAIQGTLVSVSGSTYGLVVDEATGISVPTSGGFALEGFPVGDHRILAVTRDTTTGELWVAGPAPVTVTDAEQGTVKVLAPLPLRAATPSTGQLHFRVSSLVSGLAVADAVVRIADAAGVAVPVPAPDSNGDRDVAVPEGGYFVEVDPPPPWAGSVPPPGRRAAVVLADDEFDLGTFYLVEDGTIAAAQLSCLADADCGTGGACTSGVCTGYSPPSAAPASLPTCGAFPWCPTVPGPCDLPGGLTPASCLDDPTTGYGVCVPCGSACTLDGTIVLSASACP